MAAADKTLQALREEVSELKLRLEELCDENRELRDLCNESGVEYEERLAEAAGVEIGETEPAQRAYWMMAPLPQWRQQKVRQLVAALTG